MAPHAPPSAQKTAKRQFTAVEVAKHNKANDLWVILKGKVYNVSSWVPRHPGGELPLLGTGGQDSTTPFLSFHNMSKVQPLMKAFEIGYVVDYETTPLTGDFEVLRAQITADGMYNTDYTFYYKQIAWFAFLYAMTVTCLVSESVPLILIGGLGLGFFWQQVAFVGHDCGHNSITHIREQDWWIGTWVTLAFGISGQWWKRSHNVHHIFPNSIDWDPDIQHLPFLAVDSPLLKGFHSFYHGHRFEFDNFAAFMIRFQYITFLPIMAVARFFMYVQSLVLTFNRSVQVYYRSTELLFQFLYWLQLVYLLYRIPTWSLRVAMMLLAHGFCGILHCQITLNHFAMPTYEGTGYQEEENKSDHFIKVQLATTCDVGCDPSIDWWHGGLQFQTVHHLFPRIPRHNLRYVKEHYVLPFCKKHGLNYITTPGFFHTLQIVTNKLYDQSMQVRAGKTVNWNDSYLSQILHEVLVA